MKKFPLKKHSDERGILTESTLPLEVFDDIKHFFISKSEPGIIRGNHYHKRKREWFYLLQGKAQIYLYDLRSKEKTEYLVSDQNPEMVEMEPNVVHAIKNIGENEMILLALVNEKFNYDDSDTFAYDLSNIFNQL